MPTARVSIRWTVPARSGWIATVNGATSMCAHGFSTNFFGPPSAATILANFSAAAPLSSAACSIVRAAFGVRASLPASSISVHSAIVTSCMRGSRRAPVR